MRIYIRHHHRFSSKPNFNPGGRSYSKSVPSAHPSAIDLHCQSSMMATFPIRSYYQSHHNRIVLLLDPFSVFHNRQRKEREGDNRKDPSKKRWHHKIARYCYIFGQFDGIPNVRYICVICDGTHSSVWSQLFIGSYYGHIYSLIPVILTAKLFPHQRNL